MCLRVRARSTTITYVCVWQLIIKIMHKSSSSSEEEEEEEKARLRAAVVSANDLQASTKAAAQPSVSVWSSENRYY